MKSLKNYLVKYHFKCPTADDLWVEMEVDSKKPLKHVIATWSKMNAFPIVHVIIQKKKYTINLLVCFPIKG